MAKGGFRPTAGRKPGIKELKPRAKKKPKVFSDLKPSKKPPIPRDIQTEALAENLEPLAYMLKVMNDPGESKERRDRMAIASAPFCHPRKGEGAGKKEEKSERANSAGEGRFRASAPPVLKIVKS